MLHTTRALRRASDAATARAAVTGRRPTWILGGITGGVIGLALTLGVVAGPAAGDEMPDPVAEMTALVTSTQPLMKSTDDSAFTIELADETIAAAAAINAEVAGAGLDLGAAPAQVDTADLQAWVDRLSARDALSADEVASLTAYVLMGQDRVQDEAAALQEAFAAAQEAKAAADQAAAEAAAADAALANVNTVDGAKATARTMAAENYGWGDDQFSCLESLWNKESGWNYQAYNPSGATGIPQALPGSKMASAGSDWQTNAATQIAWGLGYISSVYGAPCSAWAHSQSTNWY